MKPMKCVCGKTVVVYEQFHGPTMWSPCNANVWQNIGLTLTASWVNQSDPKQYQWVAKRWLYMGSFMSRPMWSPCNANVWKDSGYHCLTHWGRVTHICVGTNTNIGSDNGLSPGRRQAIIWTNAGIFPRNKLQWNLKRNSCIFIQVNVF